MLGKCWAGFFATYHSNESYRKRQDLGFLKNGFTFKVRQIMKLAKIFSRPPGPSFLQIKKTDA